VTESQLEEGRKAKDKIEGVGGYIYGLNGIYPLPFSALLVYPCKNKSCRFPLVI